MSVFELIVRVLYDTQREGKKEILLEIHPPPSTTMKRILKLTQKRVEVKGSDENSLK